MFQWTFVRKQHIENREKQKTKSQEAHGNSEGTAENQC